MGHSTDKEVRLSEQRKYRTWTAQQKIEIVLAARRWDNLELPHPREGRIRTGGRPISLVSSYQLGKLGSSLNDKLRNHRAEDARLEQDRTGM